MPDKIPDQFFTFFDNFIPVVHRHSDGSEMSPLVAFVPAGKVCPICPLRLLSSSFSTVAAAFQPLHATTIYCPPVLPSSVGAERGGKGLSSPFPGGFSRSVTHSYGSACSA
jgi:hypothetical protein